MTVNKAASNTPSTPDLLEAAASLFRDRNAIYGDNYKHFGKVMAGLFPNGVALMDEQSFGRFCLLLMCVHKLNRYTQSFEAGGHRDSSDDLTVYAAMLGEVDRLVAAGKL